MTDQNANILKDLVEKLNAAGEDTAEIKFWQEIFNVLTPQQQTELLAILKMEISKLEAGR